MSWLRDAILDGKTGSTSSKRIVLIMAAAAMSLAVVVLAFAAWFGHDVALSLGAVSTPLAGLGGYSYVNGKIAERAA